MNLASIIESALSKLDIVKEEKALYLVTDVISDDRLDGFIRFVDTTDLLPEGDRQLYKENISYAQFSTSTDRLTYVVHVFKPSLSEYYFILTNGSGFSLFKEQFLTVEVGVHLRDGYDFRD